VLNLDIALVAQPLDMVWMRMLAKREVELLTELGACQVVATPTVDDDLD
jgi:hypothetical protein